MVISRFMRRLLLVTALCLPLQVLPTGAATAAAATTTSSDGGWFGALASLGQAIWDGGATVASGTYSVGETIVGAGLSLGGALLTAKAATLFAVYAAPKLYKYAKGTPETPKVSRGSTGNYIKRAAYTVWDETTDTASQYKNFGRDTALAVWNAPTYARATFNSWFDWDKTTDTANTNSVLDTYKTVLGNSNIPKMMPLGDAIMAGRPKAVQAYLDTDAGYYAWEFNDGSQGAMTGITGLMLACRFAHPEIVEKFLSYRWNIDNQDNKDGHSALMHAVMIPQALKNAIAQEQNPANRQARIKSQEQNRARIVNDLISKSAKIELVDKQGRNALMLANANGLYAATMNLADAMQNQRFDMNAKDKDGKTALVYAVQGMHINNVKLLLGKYKVSVNKGATDGSDALVVANRKVGKLQNAVVQSGILHTNTLRTQIVAQATTANEVLTEEEITQRIFAGIVHIVEQQNPLLVKQLELADAIANLLDKASQVDESISIDFSAGDFDSTNSAWMQSPDDVQMSDDFGSFDPAVNYEEDAQQTNGTALPLPVQTPVAPLTSAALTAHTRASAQPVRSAHADNYQNAFSSSYEASSGNAQAARGARTAQTQRAAQVVQQPVARTQQRVAQVAPQLAPAAPVEDHGQLYTLTHRDGRTEQVSWEQFEANRVRKAAQRAQNAQQGYTVEGEASSENAEPGSAADHVQAGNTAAYEAIRLAELARQRQLNAHRTEGQTRPVATANARNGRPAQPVIATRNGALAHSRLVTPQRHQRAVRG